MKAITFLIDTLEPILVTSFQGDPNSDVSYSYIPGSTLRGAFIGQYLRQHPLSDADIVTDKTIRRLFFDGTTRFLNAYPADDEQIDTERKRSLPVPRCWFKDKGANFPPEQIRNLSYSELDSEDEETEDDTFKPEVIDGFCTVLGNSATLYHDQRRRINIHTTRHRRAGRATKESGDIFRYEAIDAGQTFRGVILCDCDQDIEYFQPILEQGNYKIGGSQSAGYGQVKIHTVESHPTEVSEVWNSNTWSEVYLSLEDRLYKRESTCLVITLLSDALIRDQWGQYNVEDPSEQLQTQLGEIELKLEKAFLSRTYVGGFNRKWGLPLPQVSAIAVGSTFIYRCESAPSLQQLQNLEARGIGDRRVDGFGRVVVNWFNDSKTFRGQKPASRKQIAVEMTNQDRDLAKQMAQHLLRQRLERRLIQEVAKLEISNGMNNSQWSRLMLVARQAMAANSTELITQLWESVPRNARDQLERTKAASMPLKQWIEEKIKNPPTETCTVAGQPPTSDLACEYTCRLIMAVAKKAMKQSDEDQPA